MSTHTFEEAVDELRDRLTPAALASIDAVYAFRFTDTGDSGALHARGADAPGWIADADLAGLAPDFEVAITRTDFTKLVFGELHPMAGMATGRMKLKGSMKQALKLDRLLKA